MFCIVLYPTVDIVIVFSNKLTNPLIHQTGSEVLVLESKLNIISKVEDAVTHQGLLSCTAQ